MTPRPMETERTNVKDNFNKTPVQQNPETYGSHFWHRDLTSTSMEMETHLLW